MFFADLIIHVFYVISTRVYLVWVYLVYQVYQVYWIYWVYRQH